MYLQKNAVDLGIVTCNEDAMLRFYRDTLELPLVGEVPVQGVGVIKKIQCGDSVIKLLVLAQPPANTLSKNDGPKNDGAQNNGAENGGVNFAAATGFRYCTFTVQNLAAVVDRCRAGGYRIAVEIVSPRPGLSAAMVQDPDGNTIELMHLS
jgi:catechol 2,3-dioxygenase-like lactoylglutathione lyase family enzyme